MQVGVVNSAWLLLINVTPPVMESYDDRNRKMIKEEEMPQMGTNEDRFITYMHFTPHLQVLT